MERIYALTETQVHEIQDALHHASHYAYAVDEQNARANATGEVRERPLTQALKRAAHTLHQAVWQQQSDLWGEGYDHAQLRDEHDYTLKENRRLKRAQGELSPRLRITGEEQAESPSPTWTTEVQGAQAKYAHLKGCTDTLDPE